MAGTTTYWWKDPATGKLVAVDDSGTPLPSPPALEELEGQALSSYLSAMNLEPGEVFGKSVVVDQWGHPIEPLYPEGDFGGLQPDGTWKPLSLPEGVRPPDIAWWQDPDTGKLVALGVDGKPMPSPPALTVLEGESRDAYLMAMEIGPSEVSGKTLVVDQFGRLVESVYPEGDFLPFDETGAARQVSLPNGFTPPEVAWWRDPESGELVAVDASGTPLAAPPALTVLEGEALSACLSALEIEPEDVSGKTLVIDQFGRLVDPLWPEGDFGFDEKGIPTKYPNPWDLDRSWPDDIPEEAPEVKWTKSGWEAQPPSMFYWQDPETGKLVAVDAGGSPLACPPALKVVEGELSPRHPTGEIVVDQWGRQVLPLYWEDPEGVDFGLDPETGMYVGPSAPMKSQDLMDPAGKHLGLLGPTSVSVRWWQDPETGKLVAVDRFGKPFPSPPGLKMLEGEALSAYLEAPGIHLEGLGATTIVLDQWGNRVESLYPEGDFIPFDETGALKPVTLPEDHGSPAPKAQGIGLPTVLYWQDRESGKLVAVDSEGRPLPSPPSLHELTGAQAATLGLSGPGPHVMDQFGRIVSPINPPGDFGFDDNGVYTPPEPAAAGLGEEGVGEDDATGAESPEETEIEATSEEPASDEEQFGEGESASGEQEATPLAEGDDAGRRYVGVEMAEGEVLLDADANEPSGDSRVEAPAETGDEESEGLETVEVGTALGLGGAALDQVISAGDDRVRTEARQIRVPELPDDRTLAQTIEEGSGVESAVEEMSMPGEEVEVIPITIPMPPPPEGAGEAVEGGRGGVEAPGEEVEVIPITIPMPPPPEGIGEASMDWEPPPNPDPPNRAPMTSVPLEEGTAGSPPEALGASVEGFDDDSLRFEATPLEDETFGIRTAEAEGPEEIEEESNDVEL